MPALGELPEGRKLFGPSTELIRLLGFLNDRARQGRVVAWLRRHGLLE